MTLQAIWRQFPGLCYFEDMNWNHYNRSLTARGSITVYFGNDITAKWSHPEDCNGVGRPPVYQKRQTENPALQGRDEGLPE